MLIQVTWLFFLVSFCLLDVQGRKGFGPGEQEWGYVEVRPGAHMFWWLYFTNNNNITDYYDKPLVIWIQGGPGRSGTGYGNFKEIGPLDIQFQPRNHTWVKDYNVLLIDNPVGTGFSYVSNSNDFARFNYQIAEDLMQLVHGFYNKLPRFRQVPTYIVGQSYGGKMSVEWALMWYKRQQSGYIDSKLKGLAVGGAWISPTDNVQEYATSLKKEIRESEYDVIRPVIDELEKSMQLRLWRNAALLHVDLCFMVQELFHKDIYHIKRYYNETATDQSRSKLDMVMNAHVKQALSDLLDIRSNWTNQNVPIRVSLLDDTMKPVDKLVELLLDETDLKVFVYNGEFDFIVNTPGVLRWINKLRWKHAHEWLASSPVDIVVNGVVEGYRRSFGNFSFYSVNNAGHEVPVDNPVAMNAILHDFTSANSQYPS